MSREKIKKNINKFCEEYYKIQNRELSKITLNIQTFADKSNQINKTEIQAMRSQIHNLVVKFAPLHKIEIDRIRNQLKQLIPQKPEIDHMHIFSIGESEKKYTQFLKWLLDPYSNHGLDKQPLRLFLAKIVDRSFARVDLNGTSVEAEREDDGKIPDLKITGKDNEFNCILEVKIRAREGEKQTEKYYNQWYKKPNPFFIYITLIKAMPGKPGNGRNGFRNVLWDEIIKQVLEPLFGKNINKNIKDVIRSVIYNLKLNMLPTRTEIWKSFEEDGYNIENMDYCDINNIVQTIITYRKENNHG